MTLADFIATIEQEAIPRKLLTAEVISVGTGQETLKTYGLKTLHYYLVKVARGKETIDIKVYNDKEL